MATRKLRLLFLTVAALCTAQVGWWITYQVRSAQYRRVDALALLDWQRHWATDWLQALGEDAPRGEALDRWLQTRFAGLVWQEFQEGCSAKDAAISMFACGRVARRVDALAALDNQAQKQVRMFLGEGLFFVCVLGLGWFLIWRTLRREERLVHQQKNFLAAVTHEFKSPLAAVRLYVETMQLRASDRASQERYLATMARELSRLERWVGQVLSVARLDAGSLGCELVVADLAQEVAKLCDEMSAVWQKRKLTVHWQGARTGVWARFDRDLLGIVVRNILDNASKYGGSPPSVEVSVVAGDPASGKQTEVRFSDRGIGIAPSQHKQIFERFYRVGNEHVRQSEGTGVGLYLAQAVSVQQGGTLWVRDAQLGEGSTFVLGLPAAEPHR